MHAISQIFNSVRELVRSWYVVDRIRIAPTTGRLLKLRNGDSFVVFGDVYSITQREACTTDNGHRITYKVESSQRTGTLRISSDHFSHAATCARLAIDGRVLDIFDDDVSVVEREKTDRNCLADCISEVRE